MAADPLFQPLAFRNLTVKNRLLRSNVAGRLDQYDGSGTQARINWELKFATGGVGVGTADGEGDGEGVGDGPSSRPQAAMPRTSDASTR